MVARTACNDLVITLQMEICLGVNLWQRSREHGMGTSRCSVRPFIRSNLLMATRNTRGLERRQRWPQPGGRTCARPYFRHWYSRSRCRWRHAASSSAIDATQLFDWAERLFLAWFPSHQPDLTWTTYVYRSYPETGNLVGVDGGVFVRVAGPSFGPGIITVGLLSAFTCFVAPQVCPAANAGAAMSVVAGSGVALDGRASSDPSGNPLKFAWSLLSQPAGSSAVLAGADTALPTFTADLAGSFVVQLVVSDSVGSSAPPQRFRSRRQIRHRIPGRCTTSTDRFLPGRRLTPASPGEGRMLCRR